MLGLNRVKNGFITVALRRSTGVLAALLVLLAASVAFASTPTEFVKSQTEKVTTILAQPDSPARTERLQVAVQEAVDFRELASRALGKHWTQRTEAEQQEFLDLLQRLLQSNYADRLEGQQLGKDYTIKYGDERIRNDRAVVRTTVTHKKESHPVVYRLTRKNDAWVIYDILIDDISLEETYRDGYVPIIEEDGWDELIKLMKERLAEVEGSAKKK